MRRRLALAVLGAIGTAAVPLGAEPSFTGVGFVSGGNNTVAEDVSADGAVVVGRQGPITEAFRWTEPSGLELLGYLYNPISEAWGVSGDGAVVVGVGSATIDPELFVFILDRAFRWTEGGGMVDLGDLPGGDVFAQAKGTSGDGSTVVGNSKSASGTEAFRWAAAGSMVGLGDLPGGVFYSDAQAVSADGSTIVGSSGSGSGTEAFRWTEGGGMIGLGDLDGMPPVTSHANAVSADGSVVVGETITSSGWEAFRWDATNGMAGLGDLPGGGFQSFAFDVSGDGSIVVGRSAGSQLEAFVWTQGTGMLRLEQVLVVALGLDITGWNLTSAEAISTDGNTIVGYGTNPSGQVEGWVAVIPEPSHAALLGSGLVALAFLDRRRAGRKSHRHPSDR
jgi:probable HAF family extracellular repeat protein